VSNVFFIQFTGYVTYFVAEGSHLWCFIAAATKRLFHNHHNIPVTNTKFPSKNFIALYTHKECTVLPGISGQWTIRH